MFGLMRPGWLLGFLTGLTPGDTLGDKQIHKAAWLTY